MPEHEELDAGTELMLKMLGTSPEKLEAERIAGLTEGRIVHFVIPDGYAAGRHRPAIVVNAWGHLSGTPCPGYANLLVFLDGTNDGMERGEFFRWETSVCYDENKGPRTWHWIEHQP